MARSFHYSVFGLAVLAVVSLGVRTAPVTAQTATSPPPSSATPGTSNTQPGAKKEPTYREIREAINLLFDPQTQRVIPQRIPAAVAKLEEAKRKYPYLPSAHMQMYQILIKSSEPFLAIVQLDEAVRADPGDPEPYVILGNIALQERRLPEAVLDFATARQLTASTTAERRATLDHAALSGLARVAEVRGDWKGAEAFLRDLMKLEPEDLIAYQRLARSLFRQGKEGDAYEVLRHAQEVDRAIVKSGKKQEVLTAEAIMAKYYDEIEGPTSKKPRIWFEAAVKNAPNDLAARQAFAIWALQKGDLSTAREQANAILKLEGTDAAKYGGSNVGSMLRGIVALRERDWAEAEKDFKSILLLEPKNFGARNNLALVLAAQVNNGKQKQTDKEKQDEMEKKQKALDLAEANYHDYPRSPDALSTYAWVSFKHNDFDQAAMAIDRYFKAGGRADPDSCTYYAYVLDHQDKKSDAKELLEKLKSAPPFVMKTEADELYEKVKNAKKPESTPPAKTP